MRKAFRAIQSAPVGYIIERKGEMSGHEGCSVLHGFQAREDILLSLSPPAAEMRAETITRRWCSRARATYNSLPTVAIPVLGNRSACCKIRLCTLGRRCDCKAGWSRSAEGRMLSEAVLLSRVGMSVTHVRRTQAEPLRCAPREHGFGGLEASVRCLPVKGLR